MNEFLRNNENKIIKETIYQEFCNSFKNYLQNIKLVENKKLLAVEKKRLNESQFSTVVETVLEKYGVPYVWGNRLVKNRCEVKLPLQNISLSNYQSTLSLHLIVSLYKETMDISLRLNTMEIFNFFVSDSYEELFTALNNIFKSKINEIYEKCRELAGYTELSEKEIQIAQISIQAYYFKIISEFDNRFELIQQKMSSIIKTRNNKTFVIFHKDFLRNPQNYKNIFDTLIRLSLHDSLGV